MIADRPVLRMSSELGRVMAAARAREQAGERVLHLERGEPDFDTPSHIVEALARAARAGETHYPDARGTVDLRLALRDKLARENRIACDPDDIVITNGGTHALFLTFQALLGAADEVLVLSPHWMAIPKLVGFAHGASMRAVPAYLDLQSGSLDGPGFAARLRAALQPQTRGIYLNSPNNPSGAVLTREQLSVMAEVAVERDLWVVSDEAYEHLLFDDARHVSIASLAGMAERTVSVFTLSKSYAMTGWRIGWVAAPAELMVGIAKVHQYGIMCAPTVAQFAALEALRIGEPFVVEMHAEYDRRRQLLTSRLNQMGLFCFEPRGAFYCFPNIARTGMDDEDFAQALLHEERVAVVPGTAFGPSGADHVRVCYATSYEELVEALDRIERFVERHPGPPAELRPA
ncbi:MAG TPA: pyridoxal phosphate-dependent aminotransferase [Candidatus Eisenbacteria bacterium]